MVDHTKVSDHLSGINCIVSELEAIRVKIKDENKALRLICSLTSSYECIILVLIYANETLLLNFFKTYQAIS